MAHLEVFTYRRGAFGVARFDRMGNSQEPLIVKRATVQGFTLFLCLNRNKNKHYGYLKPDIQPT